MSPRRFCARSGRFSYTAQTCQADRSTEAISAANPAKTGRPIMSRIFPLLDCVPCVPSTDLKRYFPCACRAQNCHRKAAPHAKCDQLHRFRYGAIGAAAGRPFPTRSEFADKARQCSAGIGRQAGVIEARAIIQQRPSRASSGWAPRPVRVTSWYGRCCARNWPGWCSPTWVSTVDRGQFNPGKCRAASRLHRLHQFRTARHQTRKVAGPVLPRLQTGGQELDRRS